MVATDNLQMPQEEAPFDLSAYLQVRQAQVEAALDSAMPIIIQKRLRGNALLAISWG
jgi:geranylgeranyl diphosphate synthase type II